MGSHRERSARFAQRLTSHPLPSSPKNAKKWNAFTPLAFKPSLRAFSKNQEIPTLLIPLFLCRRFFLLGFRPPSPPSLRPPLPVRASFVSSTPHSSLTAGLTLKDFSSLRRRHAPTDAFGDGTMPTAKNLLRRPRCPSTFQSRTDDPVGNTGSSGAVLRPWRVRRCPRRFNPVPSPRRCRRPRPPSSSSWTTTHLARCTTGSFRRGACGVRDGAFILRLQLLNLPSVVGSAHHGFLSPRRLRCSVLHGLFSPRRLWCARHCLSPSASAP